MRNAPPASSSRRSASQPPRTRWPAPESWPSADRAAAHEARLLVVDVERDLALFHVPALGARALPSGEATAGHTGRVFGYGPSRLEPRPFRLIRRIRARTTDVYGEQTVERDALEIAAEIDPGDSGAALANDDGDVVGIVFAASRSREGTAYAVAASELERLTPTPFAPVVAGRCP